MRAGAIAKRYAQAAYDVAQSRGTAEQWLADLQRVVAAIADPAVVRWLDSSKITAARKEEVLTSVLASPYPLFVNLLRVLMSKGRITLLPEVAQQFERLVNRARNVAVAEVTTAIPLDAAEEARIAQQLSAMTGQEVRIQTRVDPSIQGGLIARIGDRVIDGSVRTRLALLRRELVGSGT